MNKAAIPTLVATAAVGLTAIGALAQSPPSAENTAIDEVIIWGTSIRSDDTLIDNVAITLKQPDHLADLLNVVPGVQIAGSHSTVARINIRGLDDRDLVIYQDGVLQSNDMWTHVGSILVTPETLATVDVDLGVNGVDYAGLAGSVRFRTKSAKDVLGTGQRFAGRVSGAYATNASVAGSLSLAGQLTERIDALGFLRYEDRDNYDTGDGVERLGTDTDTFSGLIKLGIDIADGHRVELSHDTFQDEGDVPFFPDLSPKTSEVLTNGILIPTEYDRDITSLRVFNTLGEHTLLDTTLGYSVSRLRRDERPVAGIFGRGTLQEGEIESLTLNARGETNFDSLREGLTTRYGIEVLDQDTSYIQDIPAGTPSADQKLRSASIFASVELPLSDWLAVRSGVRQHWYELEFGDNAPEFDDVTYSFGATATVNDHLSFFADSTTLFKGPELNRPFSGGGLTKLDNPDLDPETGRNSQIGVRYQQDLAGGSFELAATGFITGIEDFIIEARAPDRTDGAVIDSNVGDLEITGVELAATFSREQFTANMTYARADYDADDLDFEPFVLSTADAVYAWRETGDTIGVDVSYMLAATGIELSWSSLFVLSKEVFNGVERPSYQVHSAFARWASPFGVDGLSVGLALDNLADENYAPHAGRTGSIPFRGDTLIFDDVAPGRNIKLTVEKLF